MKKILILLFVMMAARNVAHAQDADYGASLGFTGYQGDVAQQDVEFGDAAGGGGLFLRYHFTPQHAIRASANYFLITGDDTEKSEDFRRIDRAVTFRNSIIEFGVNYQYNILPFSAGSKRANAAPYVFLGISGISHSPQGQLYEEWYDLPDLQTEGEEYNTFSLAIPYGVGFTYSLGRNLINIGVEFGHRFTFTDYLDDVSDTYNTNLAGELSSPLSTEEKQRALLAVPSVTVAFPNAESVDDIPEEIIRQAVANRAGDIRGNPDRNDAYWYLGFTVSKSIRRIFYR